MMDYISLTIQGYNKIAKHWDGTRRHIWGELYKHIDNVIVNNNAANILDLGCGNARIIDHMSKQMYWNKIQYIGIDPSVELISISKDRYSNYNNVRFIVNDGMSIPLPDARVDMIISLAVLHHVPPREQRVWLNELRRVLRPNGVAIISVWIQDSSKEYADTYNNNTVHKRLSHNELMMGFAQYNDIRYVYMYTETELEELLQRCGLDIIDRYVESRPNSDNSNLIFVLQSAS